MNVFSQINEDIIKEIEPLIIVFGRDKIMDIAQRCNCNIYISDCFNNYYIGIEKLVKKIGENEEEKKNIQLAVDLVKKMLEIDPFKRINAENALKHEVFN